MFLAESNPATKETKKEKAKENAIPKSFNGT